MNQPMRKNGYLLLELVLYIGISVIVLTVFLSFAWGLIQDQSKQKALTEVIDGGEFVLSTISYNAERATTVSNSTVYATHPGTIVLTYPSTPNITFDTYQKNITLNGQEFAIRKLRMTVTGSSSVDLTNDNVSVNNFVLTNLSSGDAKAFSIQLTLESLNPSLSQAYDAQKSWTTAVTLKIR